LSDLPSNNEKQEWNVTSTSGIEVASIPPAGTKPIVNLLDCIMQKCEKFTEMVAEDKRGLRGIMWVSDGSQLQKAQHQLSVTHFSIQNQEDFQLAFISCILHQNGKYA
jgi:hypothetical protein